MTCDEARGLLDTADPAALTTAERSAVICHVVKCRNCDNYLAGIAQSILDGLAAHDVDTAAAVLDRAQGEANRLADRDLADAEVREMLGRALGE